MGSLLLHQQLRAFTLHVVRASVRAYLVCVLEGHDAGPGVRLKRPEQHPELRELTVPASPFIFWIFLGGSSRFNASTTWISVF